MFLMLDKVLIRRFDNVLMCELGNCCLLFQIVLKEGSFFLLVTFLMENYDQVKC